jgi:hypothetical protein
MGAVAASGAASPGPASGSRALAASCCVAAIASDGTAVLASRDPSGTPASSMPASPVALVEGGTYAQSSRPERRTLGAHDATVQLRREAAAEDAR